MRKTEGKAEIVQEIQEKVAQAQIGILADFTGLKVEAHDPACAARSRRPAAN